MDSTVDFINDVGTTVKGTVTTILTLNYVIGQTLVAFFSWIWNVFVDCAINFRQLITILLEDLAIFVAEVGETIVITVDLFYAGIDSLVSGIINGIFKTFTGLSRGIHAISSAVVWTLTTIYEFSITFGITISLAISNLVHGIWRLPIILITTIYEVTKSVLETIGETGRNTYFAIKEAPIEAFIGFITAFALTYLTVTTTKRIIRERQITAKDVFQLCKKFANYAFVVVCFISQFIINFFVGVVKNLVRTLEFTLTHLHVPRFHHAGDSDQEDNNEENDTIPDEIIADDDPETEALIRIRKRNYDLLIKRRNERRSKSKSKNTKAANNNEEVEEMLLEQVEREREDKLCVICQDQEKCIMILPCRHLCICQDCQANLLQRNNQAHSRSCPFCRRPIKQMIKAYL